MFLFSLQYRMNLLNWMRVYDPARQVFQIEDRYDSVQPHYYHLILYVAHLGLDDLMAWVLSDAGDKAREIRHGLTDALAYAVVRDNEKMVRLLADKIHHFSLHSLNSALIYAARKDDADLFQWLVENCHDESDMMKITFTDAVKTAWKYGNVKVLEYLEEADVNITEESFDSPGETSHIDEKFAWLERQYRTDINLDSILLQAVSMGSISTAGLAIKRGADVNGSNESDKQTPLALALQVDMVKLLLSRGAQADKYSPAGTPLQLACSEGHWAIVELLLERGAEINVKASTYRSVGTAVEAIVNSIRGRGRWTSDTCSLEAVNFACRLIGKGTRVVSGGELMTKLLHLACHPDQWTGEVSVLHAQYLLYQGANINATLKGKTILHWAVEFYQLHPELVRWLLENGAEGNLVHESQTPLGRVVARTSRASILMDDDPADVKAVLPPSTTA